MSRDADVDVDRASRLDLTGSQPSPWFCPRLTLVLDFFNDELDP